MPFGFFLRSKIEQSYYEIGKRDGKEITSRYAPSISKEINSK